MNDRETQELVNSYLLHQISPENKTRLLNMMEADPVFAQHVKDIEATTSVIHLARDRELRQKLKAWDDIHPPPRQRRGKGLMMLFVLISLVMASWCWMTYHFSPVPMALRSFNDVAKKSISLYEKRSFPDEWQSGLSAFRDQDFEKAMLLFSSMPATEDSLLMIHVHWNILLCQLAISGPTQEWMQELNVLSKNSPEPIRSTSEKLRFVIQSSLYHYLFLGVAHKTMTSIKPKII